MKAAGAHRTNRPSNQYMEKAVADGTSVETRLIDTTGPKRTVTGENRSPMAGTLVSSSKLNPCGWNWKVESSGERP